MNNIKIRSTTIVGVLRNGRVAMAGDGQVTLQTTVLKHGARKIRKLYHGKVVAGFAGSVADAQSLADTFEQKLEASGGNLTRAAVEFAREWRTDRVLRKLEAMMLVSDGHLLYILSGDGNVVEPDDGAAAIGSGGAYALAAARAMLAHSALEADAIAEEALKIASEICIYTNDRIILETLP